MPKEHSATNPNMFAQKNRLTKDKEFDNVFKHGRSSYNKILGIKAIKNDLGENRYGILVSTKVSKKAVERNKLKRQIREILKNIKLDLKDTFDIVVITLPGSLEKEFKELENSVKINLRKLKLIK